MLLVTGHSGHFGSYAHSEINSDPRAFQRLCGYLASQGWDRRTQQKKKTALSPANSKASLCFLSTKEMDTTGKTVGNTLWLRGEGNKLQWSYCYTWKGSRNEPFVLKLRKLTVWEPLEQKMVINGEWIHWKAEEMNEVKRWLQQKKASQDTLCGKQKAFMQ